MADHTNDRYVAIGIFGQLSEGVAIRLFLVAAWGVSHRQQGPGELRALARQQRIVLDACEHLDALLEHVERDLVFGQLQGPTSYRLQHPELVLGPAIVQDAVHDQIAELVTRELRRIRGQAVHQGLQLLEDAMLAATLDQLLHHSASVRVARQGLGLLVQRGCHDAQVVRRQAVHALLHNDISMWAFDVRPDVVQPLLREDDWQLLRQPPERCLHDMKGVLVQDKLSDMPAEGVQDQVLLLCI
mmetsp:Transcript_29748/g.85588  ORF Transcript_29748/g.85588 Transcript_29748/m.85588 type:complete len:243 (+) Transcript_29748:595-1323(+)